MNLPSLTSFLWLQVGVIRPISRAHDSNRAKDGDKSLAKETSKEPVTETLNNRVNKVSAVEHKDLNGENKKETLIIEKDPLFVPIESWKENNTQVMTNKILVRLVTNPIDF